MQPEDCLYAFEVSIPASGIFVFLPGCSTNYRPDCKPVSIPASGIFVFLPGCSTNYRPDCKPVSIPASGIFVFLRVNLPGVFNLLMVSIPASGIFVFLPAAIIFLVMMVKVSIPASGIFVFLPGWVYPGGSVGLALYVSIPASGIFVFLHGEWGAILHSIRLFQSRRAGFLFFYRFGRARPTVMEYRFNPGERDFCFSTRDYGYGS